MKTLVFLEQNPLTECLRDISVELSYKAHSLMKPFSGEVVSVFVGKSFPKDIERTFAYGANRLIYFLQNDLKNFHGKAYCSVLESIIAKEKPDIVLFGATHLGRELAPLLSAALSTGLTADCTQLHISPYKDKGNILYQVRPAFGGNILATIITPDHRPMMATVRENVMPLPEIKVNNVVKTEEFRFNLNHDLIKNEFLSIIAKDEKVNFANSNVIVSGGAGVGSKESFDLINSLAHVLGGEVGASRAAVDFGYIGKERLIGQTGSVVRPKIYIACGISGSIQHRAGMEESKKIIAINTDPEAPIFKIAHLGIVGDLAEIIPIMIKSLKEEG